jgi:hypothetical protein
MSKQGERWRADRHRSFGLVIAVSISRGTEARSARCELIGGAGSMEVVLRG